MPTCAIRRSGLAGPARWSSWTAACLVLVLRHACVEGESPGSQDPPPKLLTGPVATSPHRGPLTAQAEPPQAQPSGAQSQGASAPPRGEGPRETGTQPDVPAPASSSVDAPGRDAAGQADPFLGLGPKPPPVEPDDSPHVKYRKKKAIREWREEQWRYVVDLRQEFNRNTKVRPPRDDVAAGRDRHQKLERLLVKTRRALPSVEPDFRLFILELVYKLHSELGTPEFEETYFTYLEEHERRHGKDSADNKLASLANQKFLAGDHPAATHYYEVLTARKPDKTILAKVRKRLGEMLLARGQLPAAMEHLYWVMDNVPGTRCAVDACKVAEETLANAGEHTKALELLARLETKLGMTPEDRQYAKLRRGVIFFVTNRPADAAKAFREIIDLYPPEDYVVHQAKAFLKTIQSRAKSQKTD